MVKFSLKYRILHNGGWRRKMQNYIDSYRIHKLQAMIDSMEDWMLIGDQEGRIQAVNQQALRAYGSKREEILGKDILLFVGVNAQKESMKHEFESICLNKEGKKFYLRNYFFKVETNEGEKYSVCICKDKTESNINHNMERIEKEVEKALLPVYPDYDRLIDYVQKYYFNDRVAKKPFAIIFINIRGINEINNQYSITVGDAVLKEVRKRIQQVKQNRSSVFNYKGNVFALILEADDLVNEIQQFRQEIHKEIMKPIGIEYREMTVSWNMGISFYTKDIKNANEIIKNTELALLYARKQGKGCDVVYSKKMQIYNDRNIRLEKELVKAVKDDEFVVYYQPLINLKNQKIVGMEALLRRRKANGEIEMPSKFIEPLERFNLIDKVGMKVVGQVCRQIREWLDKGYPIVPISINLSAKQFQNPLLADDIDRFLNMYRISAKYIHLEITESTVMEDVEIAKQVIDELKSKGFNISMDDFGTGFASIGYLKKFMFNHLKIDISFIKNIAKSQQDQAIVKAIITIAKSLNLKTIAEGVENKEQSDIIHRMGCEIGQGFLWNSALSAQKIEQNYFGIIGVN